MKQQTKAATEIFCQRIPSGVGEEWLETIQPHHSKGYVLACLMGIWINMSPDERCMLYAGAVSEKDGARAIRLWVHLPKMLQKELSRWMGKREEYDPLLAERLSEAVKSFLEEKPPRARKRRKGAK